MMKAEDAKALASAAKLCIREKEITASMAKVRVGGGPGAEGPPVPTGSWVPLIMLTFDLAWGCRCSAWRVLAVSS